LGDPEINAINTSVYGRISVKIKIFFISILERGKSLCDNINTFVQKIASCLAKSRDLNYPGQCEL
jgi:hypothetical protein